MAGPYYNDLSHEERAFFTRYDWKTLLSQKIPFFLLRTQFMRGLTAHLHSRLERIRALAGAKGEFE